MGSEAEWTRFFAVAGIPDGIALRYAKSFVANRVSRALIGDLDKDTLIELGVTAVGDQMAILKRAKNAAAMESAVAGAPMAKAKRAPISAPGSTDERFTSLDEHCASVHRKGRPPPDRHEIYHVKMPEGTTAKTRRIMMHAEKLRAAGLAVRGTSGVRQAGQPVLSIAEQREAEVSSTTPEGGRLFSRMHADRIGGGGVVVRTGRVTKRGSGLFTTAVAAAGRTTVIGGGGGGGARNRGGSVVRVQAGTGGQRLPSVTVNLGGRVQRAGGAGVLSRRVALSGGPKTTSSATVRRAITVTGLGGGGGGARGPKRIRMVRQEEEEYDEMEEEPLDGEFVEEGYDDDAMEEYEEEDLAEAEEFVEDEEELEDDPSTIVVGPSTTSYARTRIVPAPQTARVVTHAHPRPRGGGGGFFRGGRGGGGAGRRQPMAQRVTGAPRPSVFERVSF